ncbi:MAG: DUF1848 domain-containing protein [Rhodospirillaceae bacterium]
MIVSASYRTDIPAFYGRWFMNRLAAGWVGVVNPHGGPPARISLLAADVEGFVFWSRNLEPFAEALQAVAALGQPFTLQVTATGYPRALERSTIAAERAVAQMRALRARWGPRALVWRYDPILFSSLTPAGWHESNFAGLARALEGACDEVVVSVAQPYRKTARALDAAARAHGFSWRDPPGDEKRDLVARLAGIAAGHGMALTLCTQPGLTGIPGTGPAVCIDAVRLSEVAGRPIAARRKGNRPGCACFESRDIGAYDSCSQGCAYCYAVSSAAAARSRLRAHDAAAESLGRG